MVIFTNQIMVGQIQRNNFVQHTLYEVIRFTEQELVLHNETKTFRPTGKLKHGISVVLDINSKPYFEYNKKFDKSLYDKINKEVFDIISTKNVESFLKGDI